MVETVFGPTNTQSFQEKLLSFAVGVLAGRNLAEVDRDPGGGKVVVPVTLVP